MGIKKNLTVLAMAGFCILTFEAASAQSLFNKIKQKAKDKLTGKTDTATTKSSSPAPNSGSGGSKPASTSEETKTIADYKNFDFVPGDKIIFQSNLADESTGEIPSQFTVVEGQVDVQFEDGENVIHVPKGAFAMFMPRLKNSGSLPSAYTIEFDYKNEKYGLGHINVNFGYHVNTYGPDDVLQGVGFNDVRSAWTLGQLNYPDALKDESAKPMVWHHYAIAINGDAGKAYIDQYRVVSVNNLKGKPKGINFEMIGYENSYVKNIRIASGGIEAYKKITTDNKIITHGILFDVDRTTLQAQSMGTINKIFELLQKNPALKFEVDGYTDNTGAAAHNLTLSKERAEAVKTQLVAMGIDPARLTAKGFGDTKPLGPNDSPEGKANNRRVEFVKIN